MANQPKDVTEAEFAVLNVLWAHGTNPVRGIVEAVYGKHNHSLHATVKSLLKRLADKGLVSRERWGGVHLFSAKVDRERLVAQQLQALADNNFGGSLTPLLSTLVESVKLSRADREAIRRIIEKIE
jgi:predicted transcriptional regulator